MKAVQFADIDKVKLIDTFEPVITKPNEVKIKIAATGICASDLAGLHGTNRLRKPPLISGHEASGVVTEVGEGVTAIKVGDRVAIEPHYGCGKCTSCREGRYNTCTDKKLLGTNYWQGTFAEYVIVPEQTVIPIPDSMSFEIAALLEPLAVGLHGVRISRMEKGKTCAIIGAGPMGLVSVMAAKLYGAEKIILLATRDYQMEAAKKLGADIIINAKEENSVDAVLAATDGEGVDIVYMAGGHPTTMDEAVHMAKRNGQIIQVTHFRKGSPDFDITLFLWKQLNLQGSYMYTREDYEIIIDAITSGKIDPSPLLTRVSPVDEAVDMFEAVQDASTKNIKVMMTF